MKRQISGRQRQIFQIMTGLLVGMALLWFTGCGLRGDGVPRRLEADYGVSVTENRLGMMVTPPDAVDPTPPVGMASTTAINSLNRYNKTFAPKKEKTGTMIISPRSGQ